MERYIKKAVDEVMMTDEYEVSVDEKASAEIYAAEEEDVPDEDAENGLLPGEDEGESSGRSNYLPREKPFTVEQLVRRAHNGLGHPSNDRLARILKSAGAKDEAITVAKKLRCSTCEQHRATRPARQAAPPKELGTNEIVGVDTIYATHPSGKRKMCLNLVDWGTRFQMVIPLADHTPGTARRGYMQWIRLFGPPAKVYTDLGKEFRGAFTSGVEADSTWLDPSSLEMPTQRSITERAGQAFKTIVEKAMTHYVCQTDEEWKELIDVTNMTCNRLINKSGFSPIQRVLGYNPRVSGGLMTGGYNDWATASRQGGDLQIQRSQAMRLAAAKAFHEADCSQALRNSLHAGHRPLPNYEVGQMVYFWRKAQHQPKHNGPEYWHGPARVILVSMPSSVWVSYQGYVVKAAPEQLRHASDEETFTISEWIDGIVDTRRRLEQEPKRGYIDLTEQPIPDFEHRPGGPQREEPRQPVRRLHGKTDKQEVEFREGVHDYWTYEGEVVTRWHQQPRQQLFHPTEADLECPVPINSLTSSRTTFILDEEGKEVRNIVDEWDAREPTILTEPLPPQWLGRTEFTVKQTDRGAHLPIIREPPGLEEQREAKRARMFPEDHKIPEAKEEAVIQNDERMNDLPDDETDRRGEVRERSDQGEDEEEQPTKRLRTEMLEIYNLTLSKMMARLSRKKSRTIWIRVPMNS